MGIPDPHLWMRMWNENRVLGLGLEVDFQTQRNNHQLVTSSSVILILVGIYRFAFLNFIRAPESTSLNYMGIVDTLGIDISDMRNDSSSDQVAAARDSRIDDTSVNENNNNNNNNSVDVEAPAEGVRDSPYQRYDIQQAARWAEQILPFSMLLFVVFIRQHLQGFFVTIWIAAFMFKSNDILRNQTALKGERKISVLVSLSLLFTLHVAAVYWLFGKEDVIYPLVMLPPKTVPPFWQAIFIIFVNDILARQASMVLKCFLLMYYKSSRGRNRRKQGQMLTLVEYSLLLYRALLPAPVWYRFFFNKEYGTLFSSLMTGLYLTFKLTSIVEKVKSFISAIKALSRKEIHYGAYATSEQAHSIFNNLNVFHMVKAAGDLCTICQEKMHAPVVLRCKHVFCEECVSECRLFFWSNKECEYTKFSDWTSLLAENYFW
ncbi:RING finger and transmembrane domain-containing protein 2 isoform X1 [Tanacetum coccineum]